MGVGTERQALRGDGVSFPAVNRVVNAARLDIVDDDGFRIGYLVQITEQLTRNVFRIRHLNSLDAGRTIEQSPNVEDATLTIQGYSLYDKTIVDRGSLIHRLGGPMAAAKSLAGQGIGFNITMLEVHPTTGETVKTHWLDCWITSHNRTRAIGNVVQIDQCGVQVGIRA